MPIIQCPSCGKDLMVESTVRLPPWCSKCGADLKPGMVRLPESTAPVSPPVVATAVSTPAAPTSNSFRCVQCSQVISIDSTGRKPPWCPKCGSDLKQVSEETGAMVPPEVVAVDAPPPSEQQSLEEAIRRIRSAKRFPPARASTLRRTALGLLGGGLSLLVLCGMFSWLFSTEEELYLPMRLLVIAGFVTTAGLGGLLYAASNPESPEVDVS